MTFHSDADAAERRKGAQSEERRAKSVIRVTSQQASLGFLELRTRKQSKGKADRADTETTTTSRPAPISTSYHPASEHTSHISQR